MSRRGGCSTGMTMTPTKPVSHPLWKYEDAVSNLPRKAGEALLVWLERIRVAVENMPGHGGSSAVRLPYREPGSDDE